MARYSHSKRRSTTTTRTRKDAAVLCCTSLQLEGDTTVIDAENDIFGPREYDVNFTQFMKDAGDRYEALNHPVDEWAGYSPSHFHKKSPSEKASRLSDGDNKRPTHVMKAVRYSKMAGEDREREEATMRFFSHQLAEEGTDLVKFLEAKAGNEGLLEFGRKKAMKEYVCKLHGKRYEVELFTRGEAEVAEKK